MPLSRFLPTQWWRYLTLRRVLIAAFALQACLAIGLVGYLSVQNGQQAVNDIAAQLRSEMTARISAKLRTYITSPHDINQLNANALAHDDLDVDAARGESLLWQEMQVFPNIAFIYCGSPRNGNFFGVLRQPETGQLELSYGNASNENYRENYSLDVRGNRAHRVRQSDRRYDARLRPWYRAAIAAGQPVWSELYIAFSTRLPNITASLPVYNKTGNELIGVCGVDVVLPEEFRTFLQELDIGRSGEAFVLDRAGTLISSSTAEPLTTSNSEDEPEFIAATDSRDPLVRQTASFLARQFGDFAAIDTAQQLDFNLEGERQLLQVVPFRDEHGLDWLIAVVVPEAEFMGRIAANTRLTLWLIVAALAIAIVVGALASRWLAQPLIDLTRASQVMASGATAPDVRTSKIRELRQLTQTFNRMAAQLHHSFTTLQQSEATNRALVAAIPDLLIRLHRDGTYLETVSGSEFLLHDREPQPGERLHIREILPPDLVEERLVQVQKALATDRVQVYEQAIERRSQLRYEEVRLVAIGSDEVLAIIRDITTRKLAEQALASAKEQLAQQVDERTQQLSQAYAEIAALNRKLQAENLRLGAELDIAKQMQRSILPRSPELAAVPGLDIAGLMEPAEEVGGDYYDVLYHDGVVTLGIGDVTGHGLESGVLMVMTQAIVRVLQELRETEPSRYLAAINRTLYHNIQRMQSEKNLTLAILTYADGRVQISGQHEEVLVLRADGRIERIDTIDLGFPIGLEPEIAPFIAAQQLELAPGDGLVLYTDGITEAENPAGDRYGLPRLQAIARQHWSQPAAAICAAVLADVRQHIGTQKIFDDITLLILKRLAEPAAPSAAPSSKAINGQTAGRDGP